MTGDIIVSRAQATDILKAVKGIGELLKKLPSRPENEAVLYAIMGNLAAIEMKLHGIPRATQN